MAVEAKRGCGYRKTGGLYLVASGIGVPCDRMPYPLGVCPCCGGGIKQTRSFQWIGAEMLNAPPICPSKKVEEGLPPIKWGCFTCPVCNPTGVLQVPQGKAGLLWVGEEHYPTPGDWGGEATRIGVSKRISAVPAGLEFGKTWVLIAHPKAIWKPCKDHGPISCGKPQMDSFLFKDCKACSGTGTVYTPGICHAFIPQACELIVTPSMQKQAWVKKLQKKHGNDLRLVEVPENDPDHAPIVRKSARQKAMERAARATAKTEEE